MRAATASELTLSRPIRARIAMYASGLRYVSCACGVGHDEDPVTAVRGADGGSRYAVPFRVVPDLGQVSEYSSEPQGKVPCDVFQQDPSGS